MADDISAAKAITDGSTEQRLDAIIRRQGCKPKSTQSGFRLPPRAVASARTNSSSSPTPHLRSLSHE